MDSDQAKMIELEDENRRSSQLQLGLGDPTITIQLEYFSDLLQIKWLQNLEHANAMIRTSTGRPTASYFEQSPHEMLFTAHNELGKHALYKNMQDWPEIYGFEWKTPDMLLEKPQFLLFDCFLNIEFGKAVGVFELLSSEDQVVHLRQFSLVSALLSQCFYASKDSLDALVLPDKTYVFMIQLNDLSMEAEPLRHLHRLCSMDLIRPISQLNLSVQEYVLIKLVACFIPDYFKMSESGCKMLQLHLFKAIRMLERYLICMYGEEQGSNRLQEIFKALLEMNKSAFHTRHYHKLFQQHFGPRKHQSPIYEKIVSL